MKNHRVFALLLCLALLLCGCAGEAPTPTAPPEPTAAPEPAVTLEPPPTPPTVPPKESEEKPTYPMQAEVSVTRGEVADGVYRNPSLGLCFVTPEGWSLAPTEQLSYLNGISDPELPDWLQDFVTDGSSISQELMQYVLALNGSFMELYCTKTGGSAGIVYSLPQPEESLDEQAYFEAHSASMIRSLEGMGLEDVRLELETLELAGSPHVCAVVRGQAGGMELQQLNFVLLREDVTVELNVTALDEQTLAEGLAAFTALDAA